MTTDNTLPTLIPPIALSNSLDGSIYPDRKTYQNLKELNYVSVLDDTTGIAIDKVRVISMYLDKEGQLTAIPHKAPIFILLPETLDNPAYADAVIDGFGKGRLDVALGASMLQENLVLRSWQKHFNLSPTAVFHDAWTGVSFMAFSRQLKQTPVSKGVHTALKHGY